MVGWLVGWLVGRVEPLNFWPARVLRPLAELRTTSLHQISLITTCSSSREVCSAAHHIIITGGWLMDVTFTRVRSIENCPLEQSWLAVCSVWSASMTAAIDRANHTAAAVAAAEHKPTSQPTTQSSTYIRHTRATITSHLRRLAAALHDVRTVRLAVCTRWSMQRRSHRLTVMHWRCRRVASLVSVNRLHPPPLLRVCCCALTDGTAAAAAARPTHSHRTGCC